MTRAFALALACALAACGPDPSAKAKALTGGNPDRGRTLVVRAGCGTCHDIPDVGRATSHVGPPLSGLASRLYLAGQLPNTPDNLERWIIDPQGIVPGNVMPDMHVDATDARDIAAFLYSLP
jgi:cytochrome c